MVAAATVLISSVKFTSITNGIRYFNKGTGDVRGFALNPTNRGAKIASMGAYDVDKLSKGLTDPCLDTCQALMIRHFNEGEGQKCLFMLDDMDVLPNGKKMQSKKPKQVKEGSLADSKLVEPAFDVQKAYQEWLIANGYLKQAARKLGEPAVDIQRANQR